MPTPRTFSVRLFTAYKQHYRTISGAKDKAGAVISAQWSITRTEGYADAELVLAGPAKACRGMVNGRRIEFWGVDAAGAEVRLYRGEVVRVAQDRTNGATQTTVTLLGIWLKVSKLVVRQRYAWVDKPDLSESFTRIASTWVAGKYANVRVEASPTGQTIDSIDGWRRSFGDVTNDLIDATGGFAVSGCDVSEITGQDRLFFRAYDSPTNVTHWLRFPDPSRRVTIYDRDTDASKIANIVDLVGGSHRFPNLLAEAVEGNTSFEQPQFNAATTGNLLVDAGFEDRDASDIYGGASYKSGGLSEGPTDGGETMLELDNVGEGFVKEVTTQIFAGNEYTFEPRLRLATGASIGSKIRLSIAWYNGNTLLDTDTKDYDDSNLLDSATWQSFDVTGICPDGTTRFECRGELITKVGQGILVDNLSAYDSSMIRQAGWMVKPTGSAVIEKLKWNYEGGYHGAYAVYAKVQAENISFNDVAFYPLGDARFTVSGNQTLRLGVWVRLAPGVLTAPLCMLRVEDSTGQSDELFFTPGVDAPDATDGVWMLYTFTQTVNENADNATYNFTIRGDGEIIFDACQVRDAAVTVAEMAADFLEAEAIEAVVRADASQFAGTPVADSIETWGEIPTTDDINATTQDDIQAYAAAKLKAVAVPIEKPPIEVVGHAVAFWPGQYIGAIGRDAAEVMPEPLPIAEVEGSYQDGLLRLRPITVSERESETRVTRRIARDAARKAGGSGGRSYSPGGGAGSPGGGGIADGQGYATIQEEGVALTPRGTINFLGTGVTAADNALTGATDVTIPGSVGGGGVTDHGDLTGLADDDHTQYYNQTRGDARYAQQVELDSEITARTDADTLIQADIDAHEARTDNPHSTTAAQVGSYTTGQTDTLLAGKSNVGHTHPASDIVSGTLNTARMGSGTANNTTYLRGDNTWAAVASGTPLTVQDEGSPLTQRAVLNFVGANVSATDDAANGRTLITVTGTSGTPTYNTRQINPSGGTLASTDDLVEATGNIGLSIPPANDLTRKKYYIVAKAGTVDISFQGTGNTAFTLALGQTVILEPAIGNTWNIFAPPAVATTATNPIFVQDEGNARQQRTTLNFTGAGVSVSDDTVGGKTTINVPGASALLGRSEGLGSATLQSTDGLLECNADNILYVPAANTMPKKPYYIVAQGGDWDVQFDSVNDTDFILPQGQSVILMPGVGNYWVQFGLSPSTPGVMSVE